VIYSVPPAEYLDRMRRMLHARGKVDGTIRPEVIRAIIAEVALLDLDIGARYRLRLLGGKPSMGVVHGIDEAGQEWHLELPDVLDAEWLEREAVYLGRWEEPPWRGLLMFEFLEGAGALADMDLMYVEGPL
jgi:hypothetical protein